MFNLHKSLDEQLTDAGSRSEEQQTNVEKANQIRNDGVALIQYQ